jgi:MFS family permease
LEGAATGRGFMGITSDVERMPMNAPRPRYKWELLALFWLAYFFNQGDRQIFSAVLPLVKTDLGLDDVQLGMVATAFTFVFGMLVPVAGFLGDLVSRKWMVCLSLLVFSGGTLLTGFANGVLGLMFFRSIATGAGEACYYPAANSLIGEHHRQTRAQAMAIHLTALYVGIVVSSWLAGWIGELHGWRASFYTFGFLGLLLTVVVAWRIRDDRPNVDDGCEVEQLRGPGLGEMFRVVLGKPTLYFLSLAYAGMVFVNVGYMTWMPTFLYEKFGLSLGPAALHAVLWHYVFAFVGVLIGGRWGDRLAARRRTIRMEIEGLALLLGAPFIYLLGACSELSIVYVGLAGFGFFRGLYDSNIFAAMFDVIPPRCRSSATGLMLFCSFSMGATSPVLLGVVKQRVGLSVGLSSMSVAYLCSSALIFVALWLFFARDYYGEAEAPSGGQTPQP